MSKKHRNTPTGRETSIVNGVLYFEDARQADVGSATFTDIIGDGYTNSIRVVSLSTEWYVNVYLGSGVSVKEDINVQMTLRRENRAGRGYWYAYRRVFGRLYKRYVGTDEQIDQERLLSVARKMPSA